MISDDIRFDDTTLEMSKTSLRSLGTEIAKDQLVTLNFDDNVKFALQRLTDNNILSAPVFDDRGVFWGFTDMQQLTRIVVRYCSGQAPPAPGDFFDRSAPLRTTTIRDLVQGRTGRGFIYGEYSPPISEDSSLYQAVERMAREGQHRLAVQDYTGRICGIVCQSAVLEWLNSHMDLLKAGSDIKISELRPYSFLVTLPETERALRAFELMDARNVSMNGVVLVDSAGKLTDVMSTRDLKGLVPGSINFKALWNSCREFKQKLRARYPGDRKFPVTVRNSSTLTDVIRKMALNHVHRVVVVDENNRPLDVITQTDLLRFILRCVTSEWW